MRQKTHWSILAKPCASNSAELVAEAARTTFVGDFEVRAADAVELDDQVEAPLLGGVESAAEGELGRFVELELEVKRATERTAECLSRMQKDGLQ